jgi:hypothetical protein
MKITISRRTIVIALIAIAIVYSLNVLRARASAGAGDKKKVWTVYGTMSCGWTRKQLENLKSKNVPHKFVDCEKGGCDGKNAFPTLVSPSGEELVGYTEF